MNDEAVRRALREGLAGRSAHVDLAAALNGLPADLRGRRAPGLPHSAWELVEHLRLSLDDLVTYALDAQASSPPWPEGYWPQPRDPVDDATWNASREGVARGVATMRAWLDDPGFDPSADIPHSDALPDGGKRSYLRQILVAIDHTGYHVGQIVQVRRALDTW